MTQVVSKSSRIIFQKNIANEKCQIGELQELSQAT